jgi:hypothetical protein
MVQTQASADPSVDFQWIPAQQEGVLSCLASFIIVHFCLDECFIVLACLEAALCGKKKKSEA